MGKVDCVMEAIEKGVYERSIEIATNLLKNTDFSLEDIAKNTGLPLEKVEELKRNV